MTQQCFYREVLGDGVPHKVAEVSHSNVTHYVPLTTVVTGSDSYSEMLNAVQVATKNRSGEVSPSGASSIP